MLARRKKQEDRQALAATIVAAARQMARDHDDVGEEKQEDRPALAATIVAAARQMARDYDCKYLAQEEQDDHFRRPGSASLSRTVNEPPGSGSRQRAHLARPGQQTTQCDKTVPGDEQLAPASFLRSWRRVSFSRHTMSCNTGKVV